MEGAFRSEPALSIAEGMTNTARINHNPYYAEAWRDEAMSSGGNAEGSGLRMVGLSRSQPRSFTPLRFVQDDKRALSPRRSLVRSANPRQALSIGGTPQAP